MFVVVMGWPCLHNRHFPQLHAVKFTRGAVPCVTASIDDKAKRTAAQVAALGQCDQVAAGLGVGHIQCERQPGFILAQRRSEEHTSELQSLMRISYAVLCLKKKNE